MGLLGVLDSTATADFVDQICDGGVIVAIHERRVFAEVAAKGRVVGDVGSNPLSGIVGANLRVQCGTCFFHRVSSMLICKRRA